MSAATKLPFDLTVDEFFDWCPEDGNRWELMDGEPQAMAPARGGHNAVMVEVARLLGNHLVARGRHCTVLATPGVIPQVRASNNFRVPDLGVTCVPVGADDRAIREPVLLIEILSPTNRRDTWANVWTYTTIPSVREILVLHTERQRADLLRRREDDSWPQDPLLVVEGELRLESIDFAAPLTALYAGSGIGAG